MKSIVVPIDDDGSSDWVADHVVPLYHQAPLQIYLLNVQPVLSRYVARFIPAGELHDYHQENGLRVLRPVMEKLDAAGVPHIDRVLVGRKAETIVQFARACGCDQIILPSETPSFLSNLGLGSIGSQIRHLVGVGAGCKISEVC